MDGRGKKTEHNTEIHIFYIFLIDFREREGREKTPLICFTYLCIH